MRLASLAVAACLAVLGMLPAAAAGVDKLYVLDCGQRMAPDQSRWSPGVNVGVPLALSDNCYLIHHAQVPGFNFSKEQSLASMQHIADIMAKEHAQLWINHDKVQSDGQRKSPEFYQ